MSEPQMNEYLFQLTILDDSTRIVFEGSEADKEEAYRQDHKYRMDNSIEMLSSITQWSINTDLKGEFQSVSVAEMHGPGKSWLLVECTEDCKQRLKDAFPTRIKDTHYLGKAPRKKYQP